MKVFIFFLSLLFWFNPAQAAVLIGFGQATGDSCTGDLLFSWHMEDATVTTGTPAGCSVGDTTATCDPNCATVISATQASDGGYSASIPTTSDDATFAVSGGDIVKRAAGTITFDIYFTSMPTASSSVIHIFDSVSGHKIDIALQGADEMRIRYVSSTDTAAATTTANLTTGTWYSIVAKWDVAGVTNKLAITANGQTVNSTASITQMTNEPTSFVIGDGYTAAVTDYFIDNIKVYGTWQ